MASKTILLTLSCNSFGREKERERSGRKGEIGQKAIILITWRDKKNNGKGMRRNERAKLS